MTDDVTTPDDAATPPGTGLTHEEKRTLMLVVVGCLVAFAVGEFLRRIERMFAKRHPVVTELAEGMTHPLRRR